MPLTSDNHLVLVKAVTSRNWLMLVIILLLSGEIGFGSIYRRSLGLRSGQCGDWCWCRFCAQGVECQNVTYFPYMPYTLNITASSRLASRSSLLRFTLNDSIGMHRKSNQPITHQKFMMKIQIDQSGSVMCSCQLWLKMVINGRKLNISAVKPWGTAKTCSCWNPEIL